MLSYNFSPFPLMESDRLQLRALNGDDADRLHILRSDEEVNRYINRSKTPSLEDTRKSINQLIQGIENNQWLYWSICLKNEQQLIGTICLWNFNEEKNIAEVGYELFPSHQGQGYMREAIEKVINYCFDTLSLFKLVALVHAENQKSINLLQSMGFYPDKTGQWIQLHEDEILDTYILDKKKECFQ